MNPLIEYIESHDGCRVLRIEGDKLKVSSLCSVTNGEGKASTETVIETIPATCSAARDWLGY